VLSEEMIRPSGSGLSVQSSALRLSTQHFS
jgi:hypothetical protein